MATIKLPRQERLIQLLTYEPITGELRWKARDRSEFESERAWASWNSRYVGQLALNWIGRRGYHRGTIEGISVQAHRVIWKLMTGKDADQVDHINGVRSDNAWINLRDVSAAGNAKNAQLRSVNKTGVPGILLYKRWENSKPKYWVRIGSESLGYFETLDEAVKVRKNAEIERGYHENHGRLPAASSPHLAIKD